jgi:hypothetical protein
VADCRRWRHIVRPRGDQVLRHADAFTQIAIGMPGGQRLDVMEGIAP